MPFSGCVKCGCVLSVNNRCIRRSSLKSEPKGEEKAWLQVAHWSLSLSSCHTPQLTTVRALSVAQFARRFAGTGQGVNWGLALIHRSGWREPGQCPLHPDLTSQPGPWFLLPLSAHPEAWLPVCTAQHTCVSYLRSEESPQDSLGSQALRQGRLSRPAEPGRRAGMALFGNRAAYLPPCEVWCERS